MNREEAKQLLPIIEAYGKGSIIQTTHKGKDNWTDYPSVPMSFDDSLRLDYRIKPEPKLRPWKPEEVPVAGFLIRFEKESMISASYLVIARDLQGVIVSNTSSYEPCLSKYSHEKLLTCEYSTDHGKTWLPCGVLE